MGLLNYPYYKTAATSCSPPFDQRQIAWNCNAGQKGGNMKRLRTDICLAKCSALRFRLSKNPRFSQRKAGVFTLKTVEMLKNKLKTEFLQLHSASFFKFMAAYLSLTHLVTAAKPRWCV